MTIFIRLGCEPNCDVRDGTVHCTHCPRDRGTFASNRPCHNKRAGVWLECGCSTTRMRSVADKQHNHAGRSNVRRCHQKGAESDEGGVNTTMSIVDTVNLHDCMLTSLILKILKMLKIANNNKNIVTAVVF